MKVRYDPEADAAYVAIGREPRRGESTSQVTEISNPLGRGEIILDFDSAGHLIGVEILSASELLRPEDLQTEAN